MSTDEQFTEMAKAYAAQFPVDRAFASAKHAPNMILRCHEFVERRKTRIALERIVELLEKRRK